MSARRRMIALLVFLGVVLAGLLVFFYLQSRGATDWSESYDSTSDHPYGTSVMRKLVRRAADSARFHLIQEPLPEALPRQPGREATYIYIGKGNYTDSTDLHALLEFVAAGHTAFISSRFLPNRLLDTLFPYGLCDSLSEETVSYHSARQVSLGIPHLSNRSYAYHFQQEADTLLYYWAFLYARDYCYLPARLTPLGTMDSIWINFARVSFGEGDFLLHTTPLAFSNFALLEESHFEYAQGVLGHVPEGPVYWDLRREQLRSLPPPQQSYSAQSPLKYVLSQPPLAWAWYLMLALGLLYVLFQAKRRQRIIPVLEKNTNTSLEFVATIGRLYFMQQNHKQLCLQKTRLFQSFLKRRYGFNARSLKDAEERRRLATVAEVDPGKLERLVILAQNIQGASLVSERTLEEYHHLLDYFYKNSK